MPPLLVEALGVSKSFDGVPALHNGAFSLASGSVHALCGGNGAGKSTFLNILMGILARDHGSIRIRGEEVAFSSPADAMRSRIAIITQELSPIPYMTVAENIYLGRETRRALGMVVDEHAMASKAKDLLDDLGFDLAPEAKMADLSLAQIQLVEIAKALSQDAEIVIMDEPTSAIGDRETHILFNAIRSITARGTGVIYVSHRLEELFQIADTYTVFRDGTYVDSGPLASIDRVDLVRLIVGHEVAAPRKSSRSSVGEPVLEVINLSHEGDFDNISLKVNAGEIVGIYGLMGSGRSEFLNAVYGVGPRSSGGVRIGGIDIPVSRPDVSIAHGMAMITEDRKDGGLVLSASVRHNISLSALPLFSRLSFIRERLERLHVRDLVARLNIKVATDVLLVSALSGGNQQKVVIARCLSTHPKLLICDEPTRGIDEGAKQEVYALLDDFVRNGGAVLLVSSEAPEVLQLSDRICIFKRGRLQAEVTAADSTQESLLHEAS